MANDTSKTDGNNRGTLLAIDDTTGEVRSVKVNTSGYLISTDVSGGTRTNSVVQQTTITSSTAETTILTAVAATFLDLYALIITNTSATVTKVTIKDSTAGTTRVVIEVPATETRGFTLPESSAISQAAVNTNWTATCGTSVASIEITALAVKAT